MIDITKQHIALAHTYTCFRTTAMVDNDLRTIKKINIIIGKLDRTDRDSYAMEVINIIRMLENITDISQVILVMYEVIDFKYHTTVEQLLLNIKRIDSSVVKKVFNDVEDNISGD